MTFLIDESVQSGKGANCVISLLHSYLEKYGMGKKQMHLHADNCAGQNKNSYVMWYLLWCVLISRHVSITMSFLLTGHTKFSCDCCFGLMKRTFRRTKVDCLEDIVKVVTDSSRAGVMYGVWSAKKMAPSWSRCTTGLPCCPPSSRRCKASRVATTSTSKPARQVWQ